MHVTHQPGLLLEESRPVVLAIGAFDGMHRGHLALIERARSAAEPRGGVVWVFTFQPHPLRVLRPEQAPPLLTSVKHRLEILEEHGVDGCVLFPFDEEVAEWAPDEFIGHLTESIPTLAGIVVGSDWRFGKQAAGDVSALQAYGASHGFEVLHVEPVLHQGEPISSTRIRAAVCQGELKEAAGLLGRPFSLRGSVVAGRRRGRTLGYPTANFHPEVDIRPPMGVYAVRARVLDRHFNGAAYRGHHDPELVEVHLLDSHLDIYGEEIEVFFEHYLRPNRSFASDDELREQIRRDIVSCRELLATGPGRSTHQGPTTS